jgi:hypothetical protein
MNRKNRGPVDRYTVECGHGGMKRNRHDPFSPNNPVQMSPVEQKDPFGGIGGPSTRNKAQDKKFAKEMGESKGRYNEKQKAARRQKVGQVAAKAASDMSEQMKADQARFSAEHDQAVAESSAMMQRQMAGTPGKAQAILKNKRV